MKRFDGDGQYGIGDHCTFALGPAPPVMLSDAKHLALRAVAGDDEILRLRSEQRNGDWRVWQQTAADGGPVFVEEVRILV
ncbi:MAG: hypothetical protein GY851_31970 [bacterium]|nr:hypothetical protein [bacterium]